MSEYDISPNRLKSFGRRRTYHEDSDDEDTEKGDSDKDNKEKDIQKDPCIKEKFSFYSKFHGYHIRKHYGGEKIKSGLRVIRSRSWIPPEDYKYDKEDREIGTIINVAKGGVVKVQWDSSDGIENCVKGENGQYDLHLFDNAQIGVLHSHVQCDGCGEHPLRGIRWKCRNCVDYDLCTRCYMEDEHDFTGHKFKRIQSENAKGEQMMSRSGLENYTTAIGIGEGATVKLRNDDKHEGKIHRQDLNLY
ncbi:E3 ubiquitin-protein ligase MIB2-like [Mytilus californianus]|uniref:E3 ubiquitin-protein ligase MIB2-like n=1 Tax=Mytilus californianus TaxID=6549 RepID=UPI00224838ED|nr:E3 ubiquitin-protein ligase MIB2-like [Mytilus californianus]